MNRFALAVLAVVAVLLGARLLSPSPVVREHAQAAAPTSKAKTPRAAVTAPVQAPAVLSPTQQFEQVAMRSPAYLRLPPDDQAWVLEQARHAWGSGQIRSGPTETYDFIDQLSGVRMFDVHERHASYDAPSERL